MYHAPAPDVERKPRARYTSTPRMRIRDPIHGSLIVSDEETRVIDSRTFQRLRHVRQLGFGDLAFPGATHTRHAHSLGASHVASRLFDAITSRSELPHATRERFRAAVGFTVGSGSTARILRVTGAVPLTRVPRCTYTRCCPAIFCF